MYMETVKKIVLIAFSGLSLLFVSNRVGANAIGNNLTQKTENIYNKTPQQEKTLISRFIKGDKKLTNKDISYIYYNYHIKDGDSIKANLTSKIDGYMKNKSYEVALSLAESSFSKLPYDISIVNRACDIAQHIKSDKVDLFVWQLAGLFHAIGTSGDGSSFEKAYKVRSLQDAYLFETLWQQTPMNDIVGKEEVSKGKDRYYVLSKKNAENKNLLKTYFVISSPK